MIAKSDIPGWLTASKKVNSQLFSELDVLLRALDRFFAADNFILAGDDLSERNFTNELATAKDAILRILGILEVVIPESKKNAFWFQKFAETKLLSPDSRDQLRQDLYRQDNAEKSIYHLYDSFINLKGIIADIAKGGEVSYMGFMNIGRMISKDIRENTFFNPFRKTFNSEFDVIRNARVSEIVRTLSPADVKKTVSLIYIYVFRFLRYLECIDIESPRPVSQNTSLLILVLLKSEIGIFRHYTDKAAVRLKGSGFGLDSFLQSMSYQFSMETKRVYSQELRDIYGRKETPQFRGKIENSRGILMNLTEQTIVQLTQQLRPEINGEKIFSKYLNRVQQSIRLREDLFALHKFLLLMEGAAANPQKRAKTFVRMKKYMAYFESFTFRLLRHDDYEEFSAMFNEVNAVTKEMLSSPDFLKIVQNITHFRIFLEATLRNIENRSELKDRPLDMERVEELIRHYL